MTSRSLGHRAPLLALVLPFVLGLVAGKQLSDPPVGVLLSTAVVGASLAIWASGRSPAVFFLSLVSALFCGGVASYALHRSRIAAWDQLPPREVAIGLRVDRIFNQADPQRTTGLGTITRAGEPVSDLIGQRVYFSLTVRAGQNRPVRSAILTTKGILVCLPRDPPSNTFDSYLANAGINFRLTRGRVLGEEKAATAYYRFCADQSERFTEILGIGVEERRPELVAVLRAMMLGQQHELSTEQIDLFRATGTMHVFSISGLHIAVIATGLHALLLLLRLPSAVRLLIGLVALWLYVDITGAAPSAVRAFVMVAVVEVAIAFRLPRNPISALATSAMIILVLDPLQLFSASFQMSYGIVAALLLLGLPLADTWQARLALFRHLPEASWGRARRCIDRVWRITLSAAAIGTAATLVSAITGILFFNLFTPGAFFANLWLIPASSTAIYMGMISLLSGLLGLAAVSDVGNHAAVLLLWAIDAGVRLSSDLPAMWFNAYFRGAWVGGAALAALLVALATGYARGWRGWQRAYWTPFTLVALTLLFGVTYGEPLP